MRWKLLRRRLSVSAPRMIVRSHLPWPLRWAAMAVMLGLSGALALWAFEVGRNIAGLDDGHKEELLRVRAELSQLRIDYAQVRQIADTADSLIKTERAAQDSLAQQVRQLEADRQSLRADLGFFERLLPSEGDGLQLRGVQAEAQLPGQLRYQMLVVQNGKGNADFKGTFELVLSGLLDGKEWTQSLPDGPQAFQVRQVTRLEGLIDHPPGAVLKSLQVRVMDAKGATKALRTLRL
jgi:hypothetical protein